jgi:hypothetical protein
LFCGPDRSEWVSECYRTPLQAARTFLEAVRREDKTVVYQCLGPDLKRRLGLAGRAEVEVAYAELKKQAPGLHLLGYAQLEELPADGDQDRTRYRVTVEGREATLWFRAYPYFTVWYQEDGGLQPYGAYLPSLDTIQEVDPELGVRVQIADSANLGGVEDAHRIREVVTGYEWKLDGLTMPQE